MRGRRKRALKGAAWLALAIVAFFALLRRDSTGLMFLLVAPFVALASLHFYQAKEKT